MKAVSLTSPPTHHKIEIASTNQHDGFRFRLLWHEKNVFAFDSIIDGVYPPQRCQQSWKKSQDSESASEWTLSGKSRSYKATENYLVLLGSRL